MTNMPTTILERYAYFMSQIRRRLDRTRAVLIDLERQLTDERARQGQTDAFMDGEFAFLQIRYVCELAALAVLDAHRDLASARTKDLLKAYGADRIFGLLEDVSPHAFPVAIHGWLDQSTGKGDIQPDADQLLTKDRLKEIYALTGAALHAGHLKGWDKGIKRYDAGLLVKAFNDLEVHLSTHRTHLLHTNQDILVMLRKPGDGSTLTLLADRLKPLK